MQASRGIRGERNLIREPDRSGAATLPMRTVTALNRPASAQPPLPTAPDAGLGFSRFAGGANVGGTLAPVRSTARPNTANRRLAGPREGELAETLHSVNTLDIYRHSSARGRWPCQNWHPCQAGGEFNLSASPERRRERVTLTHRSHKVVSAPPPALLSPALCLSLFGEASPSCKAEPRGKT
ncbi:hypothetical protein AAFF_G00165490 [Aldrovandia affinis]|uniref:Uncharacterized protein n=1 Tax=Aldrovandia affinis TaxID=143900 RepID=A0AAD7VX67_9TELE|nr:hypothetical protein AAFF_G00165490 [Aldrovandia affinis]